MLQSYDKAPTRGEYPLCDDAYTAFAFLEGLGIAYTWTPHEALATMEACRLVDEHLGFSICKNLFLCNRQGTEFYLLLMPFDKPFKTKFLSKELGVARLSFATPGQLYEQLHLTPGSVTVLGLLADKEKSVHLVIDRDLLASPMFGCHPCDNRATVAMTTEDFVKVLLPALGYKETYVELKTEE